VNAERPVGITHGSPARKERLPGGAVSRQLMLVSRLGADGQELNAVLNVIVEVELGMRREPVEPQDVVCVHGAATLDVGSWSKSGPRVARLLRPHCSQH
jgi:hypothetical protein